MSLLRTMALACAVLVLAITTLSAFIRLSRPAPGCQPWPQCASAQATPSQAARAPSAAIAAARIAHRVAASAALLLIIAMLLASYASQPVLRDPGRLVLALLGLALFLAVLGRLAADSRAPAVVLGNLLGGFALFAVNCRLVTLLVSATPGTGPWPPGWTWAAVLLLAAQIAVGAVPVAPEHAAATRLVHQAGAILVAALLIALGWPAWRRGRRAGALVVVLVLLELAGVGLLIAWPQSPGPALAHNALGALLFGAVASLGARAAAR